MTVVLNVKEKIVGKTSNRKFSMLNVQMFFLLSLLGFLFGFLGITIWEQFPKVDIASVIIPVRAQNRLEYQTYEISFSDEVKSTTVAQIKSSLSVMKLDDIPRFKFVQDSPLKVRYTGSKSSSWLYESYLVPVGHLYWVNSDFKSSDIPKRKIITSTGNGFLLKSLLKDIYNTDNLDITEVENVAMDLEARDENQFVGIVPFEDVTFDLQILTYDGKFFLDSPKEGGIPYGLSIADQLPPHIAKAVRKNTVGLVEGVFNSEDVLKINMTGVTALTRGLGYNIDASKDFGYPATKISDFLSDADLTHTSNEVSFVPGCKYEAGVRFCSKPEYVKALQDIGVDIVELTGNHNNDYGASYNASTIEKYTELGMEYFGGGLNEEDAKKLLIKDIKGSKVGFLGYNYYDSILNTGAIAGVSRAGSNRYSVDKLKNDIEEARKVVDVVVVTFQFQECYSYPSSDVIYPICYKPLSYPDQKKVFREAADFGADIVVGTQAHQPQTFELYNGKVIYYGLGNLFFDQINWIGTRQGLILSHYIYKGRLLQTRVSTTLYDNDMKPYVTTGKDRELLLNLLKEAR